MKSFDFIKKGKIITTTDGIIAKFGYAYIKDGQDVFFAPYANNIGDHICVDGVFRIFDDGWHYATEEEKERFRSAMRKYLVEQVDDILAE